MAGNPVLGSDVQIQVFRSGTPIETFDATSFRKSQDSDIRRRKLLGSRDADVRVVRNGWSGSIEIERSDGAGPALDDLVDYLDGQFFRGEPVDEIQIVETANYEDGTSRTYVYPGVRLSFDESANNDANVALSLAWTNGRARIKP